MVQFTFEGVNKAGKKVRGNLEAPSEGDLRMTLRTQGIRPTKVIKSGSKSGGGAGLMDFFKAMESVPTEHLVTFTRQLQVMISSGIPLVQALDILSGQTSDLTLKRIIKEVGEKVSQGSYFWEGLAAHPHVFPKLYISLIRAGEASGAMDSMLKRLSRYLEDSDRLGKMLKSAMMYPIIVIIIGVGVVALMLIFVIPKFEDMLKGGGQELPWITQFVIDSSHFMVNNAWYLVGGIGATYYVVSRYLKSDEGRAFMDRLLFKAPLFGPLMQKGGVARFARTLNTLLASGVNLIDAIDICRATIDNTVLEDAVAKIRTEVEAGKTLGAVIGKLGVFPSMAVQMIVVGRSTGNLDKMLEKVADFFESEVETFVGGLTKLIEPIILAFLGVMVGGMMIAMYLPIFKMAGGGAG